jgi:hypothetical protein
MRAGKRHVRRSVAIVSAALALSGCVAVWGRAYEVEFQSPESVVLKYDGTFIDRSDVLKVAQQGGAKSGREAVPQSEHTSFWNLTTIAVRCAEPK